MKSEYSPLAEKARAVLAANWLGSSTKPAPNLYPHQWSWDSAFIAIGYSHYAQDKAEKELRTLFQGQWQNGMLPHIVFNAKAKDYFPGPEFWRTDRSAYASRIPLTSGIIQPPIHATAVLHIYEHAKDRGSVLTFLEEMFPKLKAWHTFLYRERDLEESGLLYNRHPWESGQDNSPIWDRILDRIELKAEDIPEYRRVDTEMVDSADRPSNREYDRYAYLVKLGYDHNYEEKRIRKTCPFLIQDVLFNALAVRANNDLAQIAVLLGEDEKPFRKWAKLTAESLNSKLWSEEDSIYFDYDLVTDSLIGVHVAGGVPDRERAVKIRERLNSRSFCRLDDVCLAVPSYDKEKPGFSPNRYWRGPIWININWILYHGLRHYELDDYAANVRNSILKLPSDCGLFEYYDPDTCRGHGAEDFSWTAALVLDLLYEEEGIE